MSGTPDVKRFIQLLAKNQRGIQAYIATLVPNRADSDDILQETSVSLWRKWEEFDPQRDFFRWACGVAFVEVLRYRRRSASEKLWFTDELIETLAVEMVENSELQELRFAALQTCLENLTDRDREILEARYREGATTLQIAKELRRPVSTLYKLVARIRDRLHGCIESKVAQRLHP